MSLILLCACFWYELIILLNQIIWFELICLVFVNNSKIGLGVKLEVSEKLESIHNTMKLYENVLVALLNIYINGELNQWV